jgi:hypothetical protein
MISVRWVAEQGGEVGGRLMDASMLALALLLGEGRALRKRGYQRRVSVARNRWFGAFVQWKAAGNFPLQGLIHNPQMEGRWSGRGYFLQLRQNELEAT